MGRLGIFGGIALWLALVPPTEASPCRLFLADQSDWFAKLGFYVALENDSGGSGPCRLEALKITTGVADGAEWRFVIQTPAWQLNHEYVARAVIGPTGSELWLDGNRIGQIFGGFTPHYEIDLTANFVPDWASGRTEYLIVETGLTLGSSSGTSLAVLLEQQASRPLPLMLLAPGTAETARWSTGAGETIAVEARFRFVTAPDARAFAPYVDRYGQSRYGEWPAKVKSDGDLTVAADYEEKKLREWGAPSGYDAYGGVTFAGWREAATGFYRAVNRNGVWWLITPQGNPCFYIGVTTAPALDWDRTPVTARTWLFEELPPRTPPWSAVWGVNSWGQTDGTEDVAFHAVNMIRKYGSNWEEKAKELTVRRLRAWAFSGLGKWSSDVGNLPIIAVLDFWDVPNVVRHPDIFDAAIRERLRAVLGSQILPRKSDPLVAGWSVHNEYDDIITPEEVAGMLAKGSLVPAKRALVDEALAAIYGGSITAMASAWKVQAGTVDALYAAAPAPPAADIETLRRFFARRYYGFLYETVKGLDPNHLYFGFWIVPGWWVNEEDWRLIAPYCDVIGYDYYGFRFTNDLTERLLRESSKPVFLGEFGFPSTYDMQRGFGAYPEARARDDADAGDQYARYLRDAARNPYCIGVVWFQYRDEPVSGRGPGHGTDLVYGENFAFGLVDVADRPKYELVERMRIANLQAALARLGARVLTRDPRPGVVGKER